MPTKKTSKLNQKDLLSQVLKGLKVNVTAEDRKAYMDKYGLTKANLSLYLNGSIANVDRAIQMKQFFSRRIKNRNLKIKS